MFEARLVEAGTFKKILDSVKEVLNEAVFNCSENGLSLQAMDSSHVALVSLYLAASGFDLYRCDRDIAMGINLTSLIKIMRCANSDDILTIKAKDNADVVTFVFETKNGESISEYELKLMVIDQEHLAIPETVYDCVVEMPASEFARILRNLSQLGESIVIDCKLKSVLFKARGDIGSGVTTLVNCNSVDTRSSVVLQIGEPVVLAFASKYLLLFAKACLFSQRVKLSLSKDVPLVVNYDITSDDDTKGFLSFYLAPKIEDDD